MKKSSTVVSLPFRGTVAWEGCFFIKDIPELRRRIGGIGDPAYEHYSLVLDEVGIVELNALLQKTV
jgi:hypothetical protein